MSFFKSKKYCDYFTIQEKHVYTKGRIIDIKNPNKDREEIHVKDMAFRVLSPIFSIQGKFAITHVIINNGLIIEITRKIKLMNVGLGIEEWLIFGDVVDCNRQLKIDFNGRAYIKI